MKLGIRRDELADVIGSEQLVREMIADGWLKPILQEKKLTLYATSDVATAFARLMSGNRPTKIQRKAMKAIKGALK